MKLVNLTPHEINFVTSKGTITVEPSGEVARVSCKTEQVGIIDRIPVTGNVYGKVEGLPEPEENTLYIVSSLVAGRVPERADVCIPNEPVRNEKGQIVGCKSLGYIGNKKDCL